jgi:hypothetical protein
MGEEKLPCRWKELAIVEKIKKDIFPLSGLGTVSWAKRMNKRLQPPSKGGLYVVFIFFSCRFMCICIIKVKEVYR